MVLSKIFIQLFYMSMIAGYMVLAVLLARILLRKCPKIYSYILWSLVAFRLLVPVSVSTSFSFFNLSYLPDMRTEAVAENSDLTSDLTTEDESVQAPSNREEQAVQLSPKQAAGNMGTGNMTTGGMAAGTRDRVPMIASIIWLFGVGVLSFYTLFRIISMKKQLTSAVLWKDNIYEADGISSPFVFGVLRPGIYIPFSLGEAERDYILRHEKEHIRRGDHLIKYVAYVLAMVYWFHPLVWVAYRFMCQDMEMSCDEKVIKGLDEDKRKDYSRLLLSFAVKKRQFAGPLYFGENNVERRITNILKSKKGGIAAAVLGLVLIGVLILFFATDAKKLKEEEIEADQEYLAMKEEEEKLLALQAEAEAERQIIEQEKENLLAMQAEAEAERQIIEQEREKLLAMQAEAEAERQGSLYDTMKLLTEMAERDEDGYLTVKEAGYGLSYIGSSKNGAVSVYGFRSPEYGYYRGVLLFDELASGNPYRYFDWIWEPWANVQLPVMWNVDVDGDSETEFLILDRKIENRTEDAKIIPYLLVLETLDDGIMEPTILDMDAIEQELSLLIEEKRTDRQGDSVSIYIKGTDQVLLADIPREDYEEKAFTVKYEGDQLKLLLYMEDRKEGIVFKIRYDESKSAGGYFTISDPKSFSPDSSM